MIKQIRLIITLLLGIYLPLLGQNTTHKSLRAGVETLMEKQAVPGVSYIVIEDGEIVEKQILGYANVELQEKLTANHGFNVGSISKTFTAWGVMKLVEQGKLSLNDKLASFHFPCLDHITEQDQLTITVKDLLQHTAGLSVHGYEGYINGDLPDYCESLRGSKREEEKVYVKNTPGTKFEYSGGGYTILQMIIEQVSGQDFETYMETAVFKPINMDNSSFKISKRILNSSGIGHDTMKHTLPFEKFTAKAAAGLHTTINDMAKFVMAHFDNEGFLKEEFIKELQEGSLQSKNNYGKGYMIMERFGSFTLHGHGGSNDGWQAGMMIDMENKSAFIMLTNGERGKEIIFPTLMKWGMARREAMKQTD